MHALAICFAYPDIQVNHGNRNLTLMFNCTCMCHNLLSHICACLKLQSSPHQIYKFLELYINKFEFTYFSVWEQVWTLKFWESLSQRNIYIYNISHYSMILSKCLRITICYLYVLINNRASLAPPDSDQLHHLPCTVGLRIYEHLYIQL